MRELRRNPAFLNILQPLHYDHKYFLKTKPFLGVLNLPSYGLLHFDIPIKAGFGLNELFILWLYTIKKSSLSDTLWNFMYRYPQFSTVNRNWIINLIPIFLIELEKAISYEVKGSFKMTYKHQHKIRGKICYWDYSASEETPLGTLCLYDVYSYDTVRNRELFWAIEVVLDFCERIALSLPDFYIESNIKDYYLECLTYRRLLSSHNVSVKKSQQDIDELDPRSSVDLCLFIALLITQQSLFYPSDGLRSSPCLIIFLKNINFIYQNFLHQVLKEEFNVQQQGHQYPMGTTRFDFLSNEYRELKIVPDTLIFTDGQLQCVFDAKFSWSNFPSDYTNKNRNIEKNWLERNRLYQISFYAQFFNIFKGILCYPYPIEKEFISELLLTKNIIYIHYISFPMHWQSLKDFYAKVSNFKHKIKDIVE